MTSTPHKSGNKMKRTKKKKNGTFSRYFPGRFIIYKCTRQRTRHVAFAMLLMSPSDGNMFYIPTEGADMPLPVF